MPDPSPIDAARNLAPYLSTVAATEDHRCSVDKATVEMLCSRGLLRLGTPRQYGGHGASVATAVEVCAELGPEVT